jgi:HEXXH motif-containing protein
VRQATARTFATLRDAIASQRAEFAPAFDRCIAALRAGPVRPAMFALYSDLVEAISSENEQVFETTLRDLAEIELAAAGEIRVVSLTGVVLGTGMPERFVRHLDSDPAAPLHLGPVSEPELANAQQRLASTLELLDAAAPELAGEIRALIRDVVFVAGGKDADGLSFDGASCFYLWGALFLNAHAHRDRVSMAEALTHEAAHSLLLGSTFGGPLVENGESERFASPLRIDPRPMDGIVHATYVLARMYYCIERLLSCGALTPDERKQLELAKLRRRIEFSRGLEVVRFHARFTTVGRALFTGAEQYMAERLGA